MKVQQFKQIICSYDKYQEVPDKHFVNIEIKPKTSKSEMKVDQFDELIKYYIHKFIVEKETIIPKDSKSTDIAKIKLNAENEIFKRFVEKSKTQQKVYQVYRKKNIFRGYENILFDMFNKDFKEYIVNYKLKNSDKIDIELIPDHRASVEVVIKNISEMPSVDELFYFKRFEKVNYIYKQLLRNEDFVKDLNNAYDAGNTVVEKKKNIKKVFENILSTYFAEIPPEDAKEDPKTTNPKETFKISWKTFSQLQDMKNDVSNTTVINIPLTSYFKGHEGKLSTKEKIFILHKSIDKIFEKFFGMLDNIYKFNECKKVYEDKHLVIKNGFETTKQLCEISHTTKWTEIIRKPKSEETPEPVKEKKPSKKSSKAKTQENDSEE